MLLQVNIDVWKSDFEKWMISGSAFFRGKELKNNNERLCSRFRNRVFHKTYFTAVRTHEFIPTAWELELKIFPSLKKLHSNNCTFNSQVIIFNQNISVIQRKIFQFILALNWVF